MKSAISSATTETQREDEQAFIVATFKTPSEVDRATNTLAEMGVPPDELTVIDDAGTLSPQLVEARPSGATAVRYRESGSVVYMCAVAAVGGVIGLIATSGMGNVPISMVSSVGGAILGAALGYFLGRFVFGKFDDDSQGLMKHLDAKGRIAVVIQPTGEERRPTLGPNATIDQVCSRLVEQGGRCELLYRPRPQSTAAKEKLASAS
ncbi:hypothetical protein [Stratiformator vulcanicus]|uniref:Uncharacterized protein n=1 Tax=Stratiformator vulcanicus TaxID=2527980 RepID=A0A517R5U0_9PLAN|nr:hypothetical protein [Stratiformator vulcanicus]QDT39241.1 hypothetical protein Pan189_36450 [Stratiformator vulcanicus]